jgi:hypothetical protein
MRSFSLSATGRVLWEKINLLVTDPLPDGR